MSLEAYPGKFTEPDVWAHVIRLQGAGAAAPTKLYGRGITVTRAGVGDYLLTWTDNPGVFLGFHVQMNKPSAPVDMFNYHAHCGAYDVATKSLPVLTYASAAAFELPSNVFLAIVVLFKTTAV